MQDPVVGRNKPLRQAMSMAFDRKRFIELMLNGRGEPLSHIIPEGFPNYQPDLETPWSHFNMDRARQKLKEAEQIQGGPIPTITLLLPGSDTWYRQYGELIQRMMADLGVTIKIEYSTWARFQEMVDAKQAQFYSLGWQPDYPDEQTFLQLLYGKNEAPGPNSANYKNPEYDRLYERAIVMNPSPERDQLYRAMEKMAIDDVPWILTMSRTVYRLQYDWVDHVVQNTYIHSRIPYYTLDKALRQRQLKELR
jgi:ABC-type transport system substrate-binding protein